MLDRIRKLITPALFLGVCISTGYGQLGGDVATLQIAVGTQTRCPATWNTIFTSPTLGNFEFTASANATFEATAVSKAGERSKSTQKTVALEASANIGELGTISWTFSAGTSTATSIEANQVASEFPATSDIYFTPTATISSRPGVTYKASREVHLQSRDVKAFPQSNEPYTVLGGPIDFLNADNTVAFTIELEDFTIGDPPVNNSVIAVPVGTVTSCPANWRNRLSSPTLGTFEFGASATATFEATAVSKAGEIAKTTQKTVSLNASADIPQLGTIKWTFAQGTSTPTTIEAHQAAGDFPATSNIYFTPTATLSSKPGVTFKATREVQLQTTNLNSFPQVNEGYTVVGGDITFVQEGGTESFTLALSDFTIGDPPAYNSVITLPTGTITACPAGWRNIFTSPTLGNFVFDASATANFEATAASGPGEYAKTTQKALTLDASADVPQLGTIKWTFSASTTPTTIQANQLGADFPATSNIFFTPTATISSKPNVTFKATREVQLQNNRLGSFPQVNENYSVVGGPITFVQENGTESFTIELQNFLIGEPPPSEIRLPVGTITRCPAVWQNILTSPTLGNFVFDASATATFEATAVSGLGQNAKTTQKPVVLEASADVPQLGTVTWTFTGSSTPTTIEANQASGDFPATSNIYFTPTAKISSKPGVTYKATREVQLQTNGLTSFPQVNESYSVVGGPITFVQENGTESFTLELKNFTIGDPPPSPLRLPVGTITSCPARWRNVLSSPRLGTYTFDASATATFEATKVSGAGEKPKTTQKPVKLEASAEVTGLGTVRWVFSQATAKPTTIESNQVGADFPATSNIYFTPTATLSSRPGVIYKASREVQLQSTALTTFPQVDEAYTVIGGPIDFLDPNGQVAFTLTLSSFVVGGAAPDDNGNGNLR